MSLCNIIYTVSWWKYSLEIIESIFKMIKNYYIKKSYFFNVNFVLYFLNLLFFTNVYQNDIRKLRHLIKIIYIIMDIKIKID